MLWKFYGLVFLGQLSSFYLPAFPLKLILAHGQLLGIRCFVEHSAVHMTQSEQENHHSEPKVSGKSDLILYMNTKKLTYSIPGSHFSPTFDILIAMLL